MNEKPRWISKKAILAIHKDQIEQFGGSFVMRDMGLLESAISRPQNLHHYRPEANIFEIAASYGFGIAKNHPFVDGNKRTAFQAMYVFLRMNGYKITASEQGVVKTILMLASGKFEESELSKWLSENTEKVMC